MSFRDYIHTRRITDDAAGDFVLIARLDTAMPDAETWDELRHYLEGQAASESVVGSAHGVWRGYVTARFRASRENRSLPKQYNGSGAPIK